MNAHRRSATLVMRVSGLPSDVMDAFGSRLDTPLEELNRTRADLDAAREALADHLQRAIPAAPADHRGTLLAVRRDCHNHRSLERHRAGAGWHHVVEAAGALADSVAALEERGEAQRAALADACARETRRQTRHLVALLEQPALRSGLAFASLVVAASVARLRDTAPDAHGPRERRLVTTLLRYASRSALKLSPFSTFTQVGLARVRDGARPLRLARGEWERRSVVRVRRHVLDRCADLLARHGPWRRRLAVALNESALTLPDGRILFRRRSQWSGDAADGGVRYHEEALVRVRLQGACVEALRGVLAQGARTHEDLLEELERHPDLAREGSVRERVERLIEVGYLNLVPPWAADAGHLEDALLRELRRYPQDEGLARVAETLAQLVALETACATDTDALPALERMARLIERLTRQAAALAGLPAEAAIEGPQRQLYQDVWCAPRAAPQRALATLGRASLKKAMRSVAPLAGYARLWDRGQDFLHTLGAVLERSHGARCRVPLLEAFEVAQPLWQGLIKAQVQGRRAGGFWSATYNPLDLPLLRELKTWREAAQAGLDACLEDGPQGRRVSVEALEALLRRVPQRFTRAHGGVCLFLQPADRDGRLWVLNRLKEGTGRFASRYTPVAPPDLARRYTRRLARRGRSRIDGERVELLDVQCIQGDTLNVHLPQTPKILTLPGARASLPDGRVRRLSDLLVTLGRDGCPQIRDRAGQRYLPVYLGVAYRDYLPTVVKFLCAFGPSEMSAVFPKPLEHDIEGARVGARTLIGNVVLQRRTWRVPAAELRAALSAAADAEALAALHAFRRRLALPERVFVVEHVSHPFLDALYKPQYLDLTSPLFVGVLRAILAGPQAELMFVEPLPLPEEHPRDEQGRRWAVEVLADSLALKAGRPRRASAAWRRSAGAPGAGR